jgi:hypothetical protein
MELYLHSPICLHGVVLSLKHRDFTFKNTDRGAKYQSSLLCKFLFSSVMSSDSYPNIFLSTLFSNILNLCSYLSVRDQISHQYKTAGKIILVYILIFGF